MTFPLSLLAWENPPRASRSVVCHIHERCIRYNGSDRCYTAIGSTRGHATIRLPVVIASLSILTVGSEAASLKAEQWLGRERSTAVRPAGPVIGKYDGAVQGGKDKHHARVRDKCRGGTLANPLLYRRTSRNSSDICNILLNCSYRPQPQP